MVPATATDLPKTLAETVISVNKVLDQVDDKQLHTLLSELATGLAGTGQEVGKLVDQGAHPARRARPDLAGDRTA